MDIEHLREFLAITKNETLGDAAEQLYTIASSSVTRIIGSPTGLRSALKSCGRKFRICFTI